MTNDPHSWFNRRGQLVLMLTGAGGVLFLMYLLHTLFNPLGYALIIGILLYPIRQQPVARALLYATVFAAGTWLLYDSGHLLIPFAAAYIIAFLLDPLVSRLEKRKIPRGLIATLFTTGSLALLTIIVLWATPLLTEQLSKFANVLADASNNTDQWMREMGIFALFEQLGFESKQFQARMVNQTEGVIQSIYESVTSLSSGFFDGFGSVLTVLFLIVLLPFLCFFMIRDYHKIGLFIREIITPEDVSVEYTREIARVVGSYIRGQFIVVLISAVNLSIGFYLFGVPYALLLGVFAGLTNFVPTFGLWFSITVSTLVGITLGNPWFEYLPGIYVVFAVEQILESGFIVPRVVGYHVGLHPLLVMISLLLFGFMFGILGLLIAVPTVALLSVFYKQYKETKEISFLSGSELNSFISKFEQDSPRKQKEQEQTDPSV